MLFVIQKYVCKYILTLNSPAFVYYMFDFFF